MFNFREINVQIYVEEARQISNLIKNQIQKKFLIIKIQAKSDRVKYVSSII